MSGAMQQLQALQQQETAPAPPPSPEMKQLKSLQQQETGISPGGILSNFQAGLSGAGEWLKNEAPDLFKHTPAITKENPLDLRTPENTTASTLPEYMARGAGAMLPFAATGGEEAALGTLRGIAAGAGSGAGQYAGEHLAPKGWEQAGGTAGALIGGVGGAAATGPIGAAAESVAPNLTEAGRRTQVGNALTEMSGGKPPAIQQAPVQVPMDLAQATNQPDIARAVAARVPASDVLAQRTAQNEALTNTMAGTAKGYDVTQPPEVNAAQASVGYVGALQRANNAIRTHERTLWNDPSLQSVQLDATAIAKDLETQLKNVPPGLQREIASSPTGQFLQEVRNNGAVPPQGAPTNTGVLNAQGQPIMRQPAPSQPKTISLDRANAIRSDILSAGRSLKASGDNQGAAAANILGNKMLTAMENAPGLQNNPQALQAYQAARDFTRKKWDAMGFSPFQSILQPNRYGNMAATPETAAGKLFNFTAGAQTVPHGIGNVGSLLDEVKTNWKAVGNLSPQDVQSARDDLGSSLQRYIIAKALGSTDSTTTDLAGRPNVNMNQMRAWIDRNKSWLSQSGIFSPQQLQILDKVQTTAQMLSRTANLQGTIGSPTYQRLMAGGMMDRIIGRALGATGKMIAGGLGAIAGMHAGVGPEVGALGGAGAAMLASMPRAAAMRLLDQTLRDPDLAKDILSHPSPSALQRLQPKTQDAIRSALSSGAMQSSLGSTNEQVNQP